MPGAASSWLASSRPYTARRSWTCSDACPARLRSCRRAPSPRRPVAGRELHATRGATDGATGGGHGASGVTPREVPVGAVDRVAALARECTVRGSANADDAPRRPPARWPVMFGDVRVVDRVAASVASWPRLGFDGTVMNCHDDSQRSNRLAVTVGHLRVVDRVVASIASLPRLGWGSTDR